MLLFREAVRVCRSDILVIGLADKLLSPRLEELRVDLYFFCDHPVLLACDCTQLMSCSKRKEGGTAGFCATLRATPRIVCNSFAGGFGPPDKTACTRGNGE